MVAILRASGLSAALTTVVLLLIMLVRVLTESGGEYLSDIAPLGLLFGVTVWFVCFIASVIAITLLLPWFNRLTLRASFTLFVFIGFCLGAVVAYSFFSSTLPAHGQPAKMISLGRLLFTMFCLGGAGSAGSGLAWWSLKRDLNIENT